MKPTRTEAIYEAIRDAIVTGTLPKGDLILEQSIAEQYGVSKATAREILQRLCSGKYLIAYPRKGYLINEITDLQCKQIQQVRFQIEALALRLVVQHRTDAEIRTLGDILQMEQTTHDPYNTLNSRFHLRVAELSGSPIVYDTLYGFMGPISRYAITNASAGGFGPGDNCHSEIVDALLTRDAEAATHSLQRDLHLSDHET